MFYINMALNLFVFLSYKGLLRIIFSSVDFYTFNVFNAIFKDLFWHNKIFKTGGD